MAEDRRAKLAREMSHRMSADERLRAYESALNPPSQEDIDTAINVGMGRMSPDVAYGEKPLAGGLDIAEIGGIPINATDFIGTGIPSKLAMGAKMFAAPLAAALGGTAIASKASQGAKLNALANLMRKERGIFAGVNAKTADMAKLDEAKQLAAQGVPDADIWAQTGWALDTPDKMPRFEIPDDSARFVPTKWNRPYEADLSATQAKLGDAMAHDGLYDAYPSIPGMDIVNNKNIGFTRGEYHAPRSDIGLGEYMQLGLDRDARFANEAETAGRFFKKEEPYGLYWRDLIDESTAEGIPRDIAVQDTRSAMIDARKARDEMKAGALWPSADSSVKSTVLHELQHAIQQREGFARGGSPEMFKSSSSSLEGLHSYDDMAHAEQILKMAKDNGKSVDELMKNPPRWVTQNHIAIAKNFENRPDKDLQYAKNYIIEKTDPHEAYQRLAGEAESRLTQSRMNLTPEQRLAQYPYEPEYFEKATGVPLNSLIVRKGGDGTAMSVPVKFGKYNPPKELGGAFPEISGVERRPNPAVVAVTNDLTMRTLPGGKFQADYSPMFGGGKPFSAIGDDPQELMNMAMSRVQKSTGAMDGQQKYASIPNTWTGEAKKVAKNLIDEFGDVNFASSTQSKSKYATLPNGDKVRMSDHDLPSSYEGADYEFRYGGDVNTLIDIIKGLK